jgi:TolB-like protein
LSIGPNPTWVRFDLFEVDLSTQELYRHGFRIKLQQIPFRILAALIAVPGKLVTREEMHRLLWPENSIVGFDHNLNNAVNKLREALHDSLESPRYIEMLPGRGYRFVSQVHSVQHALVNDFASVVKSRLVVLPFENKTGSDEHEFLCEGITDGLIAELGRSFVKGLGVIARNTSMRYKQSRLPLEQIAAELNVDYVLSGVVLFRGKQVNVSAELVDVKEQTVRWGRRFVRELFSLQDIEEEIANGVESSLASVLPSSASRLPSRGHSANAQANESYMKGRYYWNRRHEDGLSRAKHFFEEAIRLDPDFSLGYVGLADTYIAEATWGVIPAREAMPRAKAAAQKALRISEGLGEAYVSLGMVAYCFDYAPSEGNAFSSVRLRAFRPIPWHIISMVTALFSRVASMRDFVSSSALWNLTRCPFQQFH